MAGLWNGKKLRLEEVNRFPNGAVALGESIRWDVLRLWSEIQNGLALAGKIGTLAIAGIVTAFFAVQVIASHWWLARYTYGPMEWVWRALTYGERPPMKLKSG